MFLVIGEEAHNLITQNISDDRVSLDSLSAQVILDENLIRVSHTSDLSFPFRIQTLATIVPVYASSSDIDLNAEPSLSSDPYLEFEIASGDQYSALYFPGGNSQPLRCEPYVTRLMTDRDSRIRGIFETDLVANKTVAIIGLGSGGSVCAIELAKAGVGNFILVDFDRLKVHNVSRHAAGLSSVGRYKTRAVRDIILDHNPHARIASHEIDITKEPEILEEVVSSSDVIVVATDTQLSRYMINEECLSQATVAVYGGVYERAFAGEVIRVVPGRGACYVCLRDNMADLIRSVSPQQDFDYTDDSEFEAEPGLGLDVSFVSLIHSKMALLTLLSGEDTSVEDFEEDMVIWTNASNPDSGELFSRPMKSFFIRVEKNAECPACSM